MRVMYSFLVTPDALFGEGLVRILQPTRHRVSATARSIAELRPTKIRPAVFILAPTESTPNLVEMVMQARLAAPGAKLVVLTDLYDPAVCAELLRAGASACLTKSVTPDAFVKTLDLIVSGEVVISSALLGHLLQAGARAGMARPIDGPRRTATLAELDSDLSSREAEILSCLAAGDSNKHIGRRFDIAETTVKVHVRSILRKINARNRTQAAIWALNHGAHLPSAPPNPMYSGRERLRVVASGR